MRKQKTVLRGRFGVQGRGSQWGDWVGPARALFCSSERCWVVILSHCAVVPLKQHKSQICREARAVFLFALQNHCPGCFASGARATNRGVTFPPPTGEEYDRPMRGSKYEIRVYVDIGGPSVCSSPLGVRHPECRSLAMRRGSIGRRPNQKMRFAMPILYRRLPRQGLFLRLVESMGGRGQPASQRMVLGGMGGRRPHGHPKSHPGAGQGGGDRHGALG